MTETENAFKNSIDMLSGDGWIEVLDILQDDVLGASMRLCIAVDATWSASILDASMQIGGVLNPRKNSVNDFSLYGFEWLMGVPGMPRFPVLLQLRNVPVHSVRFLGESVQKRFGFA